MRLSRGEQRWAAGVLLLVGAISLFIIYRNHLYRWHTEHPEPLLQSSFGDVTLSISERKEGENLDFEKRSYHELKVSFPFPYSEQGCEFVYGAAVYTHGDEIPEGYFFSIPSPRYLFKFRYDFKNKRCESKDLTLVESDLPREVRIQLVRVSVSEEQVTETPEPQGYLLKVESELKDSRFSTIPLSAEEPFRASETTLRMAKHSFNHEDDQIEVLITPEDSVQGRIIHEIDTRIEKCRTAGECDSIRIAVSRIADPLILESLRKADRAGLPVDIIVTGEERNWGKQLQADRSGLQIRPAPWMWLRGTLLDPETNALLPMHTKFIIFGDDLVISNNTSYIFEYFYRTREVALVYRSGKAAKIFQEIFTAIRTSVYYPVQVDLRDSVRVLFHAQRLKGYAASAQTPYLPIRTNEGVSSSSYGITLHLLEKSKQDVTLAMAPIVDGCYFYGRRRCFFEVLQSIHERSRLRLPMNAYFYLQSRYESLTSEPPLMNYFNPAFRVRLTPGFLRLSDQLGPTWENSVQMYARPLEVDSGLHHRTGLLGKATVLNGSANLAFEESINTVELIEDPSVRKKVEHEIQSFDQPYFLVRAPENTLSRTTFRGCEFVFERDVLSPPRFTRLSFPRERVRKAFSQQHPGEKIEDLKLAVPSAVIPVFRDPRRFRIEKLPLTGNVRSFSRDLCLFSEESGESYIVRMRPYAVTPQREGQALRGGT